MEGHCFKVIVYLFVKPKETQELVCQYIYLYEYLSIQECNQCRPTRLWSGQGGIPLESQEEKVQRGPMVQKKIQVFFIQIIIY